MIVVLPFLLFLIFLVVDFGKAFIQMTWLYQSAYQVSALGAESIVEERNARMNSLEQVLLTLHSQRFDRKRPVSNPVFDHLGSTPTTVVTNLRADIPVVGGRLTIPINIKADAPVLVNAKRIRQLSQQFGNPSNLVDCCGNPVGAAVSCVASCSPTASTCTFGPCP